MLRRGLKMRLSRWGLVLAAAFIWASATSVVGRQAQLPSDPAGSTLRGRVTDSTSKRPVQSVQVRIQRGTGRPQMTRTDSDGRFQFVGLPAGQYTIALLKGGFVSMRFGQRNQFDEVRSVEVRDRQVIDNLNVALPPAGAIEGRVIDDEGEPVVEATVSAMRIQYQNGERRLGQAGRPDQTDDRGHYRLYGLSAGEYLVAVAAGQVHPSVTNQTGPGSRGYAPTYFPSTEDVMNAQRVRVDPGVDTLSVDMTLRAVRLARVTGTLSSAGGRLQSGAFVSLIRSRVGASGLAPAVVGVSQVQRDGSFAIGGVPPGEYTLQGRSVPLSAVNDVATSGRVNNRSFGSGELGSMPLMVNGEDVTGLSLVAAPTGRVQGRVVVDGSPYDTRANAPLGLTAIPAGPDTLTAGPTETTLKGAPDFELLGLVGRFVLRTTGMPAGLSLERVGSAADDAADSGLTVRSGETVPNVDVVLTSQTTKLGGSVDGEGSKDVDGCTVVVFSSDKRRWALPATRYVASARVDTDGAFNIEGMPPGSYLAIAVGYVERGQWRDAEFLDGAARDATPVTLRAGTRQTVALKCYGS